MVQGVQLSGRMFHQKVVIFTIIIIIRSHCSNGPHAFSIYKSAVVQISYVHVHMRLQDYSSS